MNVELLEDRVVPSLTFLTEPTNVSTGQTLPAIKIMSSLGKADVPITVSISAQNTSGTALLGGTVTEPTDGTGTATFGDLFVYGGTSKNVTLIAQAGSDVASATSTFQVRPGGDHLYIATQIPTTVAAAALPDLTVQVLDVDGTVDKSDGAPGGPPGDTLQLYIDHNPGSAQFVDSNGVPLADQEIKATVKEGVVTFSGVRLKVAGVGYTLGVQAVDNTLLTNGTSNAFAITAAAPKALSFQIQPGYSDPADFIGAYGSRSNNSWPGITVQVVDAFGNQVTDPTALKALINGTGGAPGSVTMTAENSSGTPIIFADGKSSKTASIDPNTGVATFAPNAGGSPGNALQIGASNMGNGLKLTATWTPPTMGGTPLTAVDSQPFNLGVQRQNQIPGSKDALKIDPTTPVPTSFPVGTVLPSIKVDLIGVDGNVLVNDSTDRISLLGGGFLGTLTQTAVNGVATFNDLVILGVGGLDAGTTSKTLNFVYENLPLGELKSSPITLTAGKAAGLAFVTAGGAITGASNAGPIVITTAQPHGLKTGASVTIDAVEGNTAANGTFTVTVIDANTFSLNGSQGNGAYTKGGTWALSQLVGTITNGVFSNTITAGTFITDQLGNALQVKLVDADGNTVKSDNSTVVSIGVLLNEGRGPYFLGQGTDPTSVIYAPNQNATMHTYATATVVNGVATFGGAQDIYQPVAGNNFILSAGTNSFATTVAGSTNGFNVVPGPVTKLAFVNQPDATSAGLALNVKGPQGFPSQPGLAVAAEDVVNNIVPTFTGAVQVSLVPVNNAPGKLNGTTTVNAFQGVALFNTLTVQQTQAQSPQNYSLMAAGTDANSKPISVTSDQFTINGPLNLTFNGQTVNPQLRFQTTPPAQVLSGTKFSVLLQVFANPDVPGLPANFFAKGGQAPANVTIILRDSAGNPLPTGPFPEGDPLRAVVGDNGLISFTETITVTATTTFQMYALLDLGGLAITSTSTPQQAPTFQVTVASDPPPQGAQSSGPNSPAVVTTASPGVVQVGLGSVTTNFDTITNFPVNQATAVGQRPYPPVTSFDPAKVTGPPPQQQPNVAAGFNFAATTGAITGASNTNPIVITSPNNGLTNGATVTVSGVQGNTAANGTFTVTVLDANTFSLDGSQGNGAYTKGGTWAQAAQVPQTNKWWSSLIFPRNAGGFGLPTDSQNNELWPLYAGPLAARVNSNNPNTTDPNQFAGLGIAYLTNLTVTQTTPTTENPAKIPPGQPLSLQNPQFPGAASFNYNYTSVNDQRGYQDFSIGLPDVKADGKVLRYSDWTVTLDWAANGTDRLQATMGEGLPYVYFTAPNVGSAGQVIQLVTADALKNNGAPVMIWAIDPNTGQRMSGAASGTGPVLLEISYSVADKVNGMAVTNTVDNFYGLYLPGNVRWALSGNADGVLTATLTTALNYFSVAALPSLPSGGTAATFYPTAFNFFKQSAYAFVTGSSSSFTYNEGLDPVTNKAGEVTTTYVLGSTVKEGSPGAQPLQALYLNQAQNLSPDELASPALTSYTYVSPRGTMQIWNGSVFHTVLQYTGSLPEVPPLPTTINDTGTAPQDAHPDAWLWSNYLLPLLRSVSKGSQIDGSLTLSNIFPNSNNYFEGQSMYGVMQLVPILLEVANSSDTQLTAQDKAQANNLAQQVYNQVKDRMSDWLSASDGQDLKLLYYQPSQTQETKGNPPPLGSPGWDSVMSILSGFLSSESLNDHNLIGGYFIKVAALIAQYDSTWGDSQSFVTTPNGKETLLGAMGDVVNLIVQDVSNYNRSNPQLPFLRNFDVYQGHSWVDGAANNLAGNNQESSSESLNYASGLIMWGEATGDVALRDLGIYLYTTELDAVNTYYFNVQGTSAFPTQYTTDNGQTVRTLVTFLTGNGGAYQGFIGPNTTNVAGIQILPLGGSSYYLGANPAFVSQTYNLAIQGSSQMGSVPLTPPTYLSVIYPYQALTNADAALTNYLNNLPKIGPINGGDLFDNNAFNLHWIEVLRAYGQVDETVTADTVSYTVFKNPTTGVRTFVAYNPGSVPLTVHFYDSTGKVLLTMENIAPRTTQVSRADGSGKEVKIVNQTNPDFSIQTPLNRFFFATDASGNPIMLSNMGGQNGTGTKLGANGLDTAVTVPAGGSASNAVTFKITGVTGTLLGPTAQAFYSLWADPQFQQLSPSIHVEIVYDAFGDGTNVTTQDYDNVNLANSVPGYADFLSTSGGGVVTGSRTGPNLDPRFNPFGYPPVLKNGTITIKIWDSNATGLGTRLRTDAAEEQGRVSYLDLPYDFTAINGKPVSQIELGGQVLTAPEPELSPSLSLSSAPPLLNDSGLPAYTTTVSYSDPANKIGTVTFTPAVLTNQTLQITVDPSSGLLMNNRFAAGDPNFTSPFDFGGGQELAANALTKIIINNGNGDSVVLGSPSSTASALLAEVDLTNSGASGTLTVNNGAQTTAGNYTLSQTAITANNSNGASNLNVQLQSGVFQGGIALTTGSDSDQVNVLGTRLNEDVTLDTTGGHDAIFVGDAGSTQNVLGDLTIDNSSFNWSDLFVDNSAAANASPGVTVSSTSIIGVAPAAIDFSGQSVDDIDLQGGTNGSTYLITGVNAASTLSVESGGGNDVFYVSSAVGNGGTLNGLRNATLLIDAGGGNNFLTVSDAGRAGPDTVTLTDGTIADTALRYRIGYTGSGGSFAGVNLATGAGAVRVNVQSTAAGAVTGVINMGGADTIDVCSDTATNMGDLSGLAGTLSVIAAGGTDLLVVSEAGRETGDDVTVTASGLGSRDGAGFTINYAAAGGTFTGINFASGSGDDNFTVQGVPAGVPLALYTGGGNNLVVVGVTPDSAYNLTVVGGPPGGGNTVLGVNDLSGTATVQNMMSGVDSGVVQVLYPVGKRSTVAYFDVDQVFAAE